MTERLKRERSRWRSLGKAEPDPALEELLGSSRGNRYEERMNRPIKADGCLLLASKHTLNEHHSSQLYQTVDGKGLSLFAEQRRQSMWVTDRESKLSGKEYVQAVKVRGNLLATRSRVSRGGPSRGSAPNTSGSATSLRRGHCPSCPDKVANLAHLLQTCGRTHGLRCQRHDGLVSMLRSAFAKRGFICSEEPRIPFNGSYLKPDLVMARDAGDRVDLILVDPTVVSDQADFDLVLSQKTERYDRDCVREWLSEFAQKHVKVSEEKPLVYRIALRGLP